MDGADIGRTPWAWPEVALAVDGVAVSYTILQAAPAVVDPRLAGLVAYWTARRRDRPMPAFADIDPIDIPNLLEFLWIHDYDPATDRFRCRLMGEAARSAYSAQVKGRDVEEIISSAAYPVVAERYRAVLSIPAVGHGIGQIYSHTIGRVGTGERLYLPLADEQGRPRMILGATVYKLAAGLRDQPAAEAGARPDSLSPVSVLPKL